jgi:hypothetical protein
VPAIKQSAPSGKGTYLHNKIKLDPVLAFSVNVYHI